MYSRAFPDFAATRAHPAPSTPVGAHRAPTRVEPESALSQAHVSRTPSEALSLASIRREPAAMVPVAQMRRQLESLAQDHDPGPGSLARIRRPRCRSSLLPRPPRTPRRLPRDPPPSAPPPPPTQAAAAPGRVWPTRGPGRRRALTVRPQRRGAGGRPQRQRQGPGDRPAEVHRAAARSPAASAAPRAAGRVEPGEPRPEEGRRPLPSPASAAVGIGRGG